MSKTIAVLGAGPGLGVSVGRKFGAEGFDVALVARKQPGLDALAAELSDAGVAVRTYTADLTDLDGIPALIQRLRDAHGSIDVLYLGGTTENSFTAAELLTADTLDENMRLFTYALIESVRAVLPEMLERGSGSILYANGASALGAPAGLSGLGPALAAARNYLQTLNAEVGDRGVYVGALFIGAMIERSAGYVASLEHAPDAIAGFPVVDPDDLAALLWEQHVSRSEFEKVSHAMN